MLDHAPQRVLHAALEGGAALLGLQALAGLTRPVRRVVAGKVLAAVAAACSQAETEARHVITLDLLPFC